MAKKKKGKQKAQADLSDARDEMIAIEAIYGSAYQAAENGRGFKLRVTPGAVDDEQVSVTLEFGYPAGHPTVAPSLRVTDAHGLSVKQSRALSKMLHQIAAEFASNAEVSAFEIVTTAQNFLLDHVESACPDEAATTMTKLETPETSVLGSSGWGSLDTPAWTTFGFNALYGQVEDVGYANLPIRQQVKPPAHLVNAYQDRQGAHPAEQDAKPLARQGDYDLESLEGSDEQRHTMVGSVFSKVKSAVRGMMNFWPQPVQQLLEATPKDCGMPEDSLYEASSGQDAELRKDVLIGHLLRLVAGGRDGDMGVLPNHALPAVASELCKSNLMPRWVRDCLIQQPGMFDKAYSKLFAEELQKLKVSGTAGDLPDSWAVKRFWQPDVWQDRTQKQGFRRPSLQEPTSRYLLDFQELRTLGVGAFGKAVAAVNRLDGRQYAVKKIIVQHENPQEFSRIMREVATLSRVQHANIVRYFQAWTETSSGTDASETEGDSELQQWKRETNDGASEGTDAESSSTEAEDDSRENGDEGSRDIFDHGTQNSPPANIWSDSSTALGNGASIESSGVKIQTLYIQMEFCPRTLKQVLSKGSIDPDMAWQILRQILAGLAHLHSQGIIHRDLKPDNIFFDSQGVLKLGDFGLAKFQPVPGDPALSDDEGDPIDPFGIKRMSLRRLVSDATTQVGTSFYMSPEIVQGWARYDSAVDLYSLGVVAFELWHPFSTGMERIKLLQSLRETQELPQPWANEHAQVASVIRWLMAYNPSQRPSAKQLLQSTMLPSAVGDEQLNDLLRSLPESSETRDKVVETIFSLPKDPTELDPNELPGTPVTAQDVLEEELLRRMKGVFGRHGAVPMSSKLLGYSGEQTAPNAACLLDRSCSVFALRHEMRFPFALWLSRQAHQVAQSGKSLDDLRRFEIAWVRRKAQGRAPPAAFLQADLDFVTDSKKSIADSALLDAELIKTICEVLEALPDKPNFEIRLGHRNLLESILDYVGLEKENVKSAVEMLSTMTAMSPRNSSDRVKYWPSVNIALDGLRIHKDTINRCKKFVLQIPGEAGSALRKLRAELLPPATGADGRVISAAAMTAIDSLAAITSHLHLWNIKLPQVVLEPLLWPHADYLTGPLIQIHICPLHQEGPYTLLAAGGRYDGLLRKIWPIQALTVGNPLAGVGLSMNVKLLTQYMGHTHSLSKTPLSQADVLVCARGGGGMLPERMKLANELWAAGIRAQFLSASNPSMTHHFEFANLHRIPWLAILEKTALSTGDIVKIRNQERRIDEEVAYWDVARYLAAALNMGSHTTAARPASMQLPSGQNAERETSRDDTDTLEERKSDLKILNQKVRRKDKGRENERARDHKR